MFNSMMMGGLIPNKLANRNCTVNGKPLKQVEEELAAVFDESSIKSTHDGFSYLDIDTKMGRLTEVVGISNFTIVPIPLPMEEIRYTAVPANKDATPKECVSFLEKIVTAIVIYSDEGEPAIIKYGYGASEYGFAIKSTGEITSPDNTPDTAFSDGKKRACGALGIGEAQLKQKKAEKKGRSRQTGNKESATPSGDKMHIAVTGNFSSVSNKNKNATMAYKAPAVMKETGEKVTLWIWADKGVPEIEKCMPLTDFMKKVVNYEPGFNVIGEKKQDRGEERVYFTSLDMKKSEVA